MGERTIYPVDAVRSLGFVQEFWALAEAAGASARIEFNPQRDGFHIRLDGDEGAIAAARSTARSGGLPGYWDVPIAVEHLQGGRIERQVLRDDHYRGVGRVSYWGLPDDLIAAGIAPATRVQRGARWAKGSTRERVTWHSSFAPSGRVLYSTSQPDAMAAESFRQHEVLKAAIDAGEDLGIVRTELPTGTRWKGSRKDLIEAEICDYRHFPAGRKRLLYGDEDGRPGVSSWHTDTICREYFAHTIFWDDEANEARVRKAAASPSGEVEQAPSTRTDPGDFADRCEEFFMSTSKVLIKMISGDLLRSEALRYDKETVDKVAAALDHARQLLQSSTPAVPRAVVQREQRAAAAHDDAAYRTFMATTLEAPKKPRSKRGGATP